MRLKEIYETLIGPKDPLKERRRKLREQSHIVEYINTPVEGARPFGS